MSGKDKNRRNIDSRIIRLLFLVYIAVNINLGIAYETAGQVQYASPSSILIQAQKMLAANETQQAMPLIAKYISLNPKDPEGYYWQGIAFDILDLPENACLAYNKSIEQAGLRGLDSAELRVDIANVLLKLHRTNDAITHYERAIEINPQLTYAYINLARALIEKGDYERCLDNLDKAISLNPNFTAKQLFYYRIKALVKLARKHEAEQELQILLSKISNEKTKNEIQHEFAELN
jgi:tetratricopeptide (TPR) repeat protein